jgi:hypothetical protein
MNIRQVAPSCSVWTDGQTNMTKLIVAFRNFAKAPTKCIQVTDTVHCNKQESLQEFLRTADDTIVDVI